MGYPADFGKNKRNANNQGALNFNKRFVNNNNFVGSSSTSAFSDEKISKLLSLIKETSINTDGNGKSVHANMAGIVFNKSKFF